MMAICAVGISVSKDADTEMEHLKRQKESRMKERFSNMTEKTKLYKKEAQRDFNCMRINNSKWRKRTKEQNKQSVTSRFKYYTDKWNYMFHEAETEAQIRISLSMLNNFRNQTDTLLNLISESEGDYE